MDMDRVRGTQAERPIVENLSPISVGLPESTDWIPAGDTTHPFSEAAMVRSALTEETIQSEAIDETIEALSLNLGDYVRSKLRSSGVESAKFNRTKRALRRLIGKKKGAQSAAEGHNESSPETLLDSPDLTLGEKILEVEAWLASTKLSADQRDKFQEWSQDQLSTPGWEVGVCNALSVNQLDDEALKSVQYLYEKTQQAAVHPDGSNTLIQWFDQVSRWEDRSDRIRVLIRAIALDLSISPLENHNLRLANDLGQLSRFWGFLSVEGETKTVDHHFGLSPDSTLRLMIESLEEPWLDSTYFLDRAEELGIPQQPLPAYFRSLEEIFNLAPHGCFVDGDHRQQVEDVFKDLQQRFQKVKPTDYLA